MIRPPLCQDRCHWETIGDSFWATFSVLKTTPIEQAQMMNAMFASQCRLHWRSFSNNPCSSHNEIVWIDWKNVDCSHVPTLSMHIRANRWTTSRLGKLQFRPGFAALPTTEIGCRDNSVQNGQLKMSAVTPLHMVPRATRESLNLYLTWPLMVLHVQALLMIYA